MRPYFFLALVQGLTVALCQGTFLESNPEIREALKYNNESEDIHEDYPPRDRRERLAAARQHMSLWQRHCHNLLRHPDFFGTGLDVRYERNNSGTGKKISQLQRVNSIAVNAKRAKKWFRARRTKRKYSPTTPEDQMLNADIEEYPWTVSIQIHYTLVVEWDLNGNHYGHPIKRKTSYCTGSIIHRHFVLTAAHCIKSRDMVNDRSLLTADYNRLSFDYQEKHDRRHKYYRDLLKNQIPPHKELNENADFTDVRAKVTEVSVYYGIVRYDRDTQMVKRAKGPLNVGLENVRVHPGYVTPRELGVMKDLNDADAPPQRPPRDIYINDMAIIFLGRDQEFRYSDEANPICLPWFKSDYEVDDPEQLKEEIASCSLEIGEEFHIAGYGMWQEYWDQAAQAHVSLDSEGLSRARYKLKNVFFPATSYYFSSTYVAKAVRRQKPDLTQHPKQLPKDQRLESVRGVGSGDSGAPWVVERGDYYDKKYETGNEKYRAFAMAVVSTGYSSGLKRGKEMGADLILSSEWIKDTMIDLWTPEN